MSTTPRLQSAVPDATPSLANVLAHAPAVMGSFSRLYAYFWQQGTVPATIKEMTRIRNARITDCGYWKNVRFDSAREAGLTESTVAKITDAYAEALTSREAAALKLTDAIIGPDQRLSEETLAELRTHYSDAEIAELALGVTLFLGMSKVLICLGLEPEEMDLTALPTPGSWAASMTAGNQQRNRQWLINGNPRRRAIQGDDFKETVVDLEPLTAGCVRVQTRYLSFDPSQKGQMENVGGYAAPTRVGDVMRASGIGRVIESRAADIPEGALVLGSLGWQEYATLPGHAVEVLPEDAAPTAYLGPLGGTGLSAYFGLLRVGQPEAGDTLVVTGAAGAVGSMVGQIGRIAGCRIVGIAGGPEKCRWLVDEVGFDAAIDYKNDSVRERLKAECPKGINVFFDNVGGPALNDGLARLAPHARVVICGAISRYEEAELPPGPANYFNLVFTRASMRGFLLNDYTSEFGTARERIRAWLEAGEIVYREDVQQGFENIPATLMRLFRGENFGKQLLEL